jgi:hypothetical protein
MFRPARHHWTGSAVRSVHVYTASHAVKQCTCQATFRNTRSEPHVTQTGAKRMQRGGLACTLGCVWPNLPQWVGKFIEHVAAVHLAREDTHRHLRAEPTVRKIP